jgi:uncharacterized membrane protein
MIEFGPIQLVALGFPDVNKLKGDMLREIFRLSEAGIIRLVGLSTIVKDEQGNVESSAAQISGLSDEERTKLGAAVGALIGYGAAGMEGAETGAIAGAAIAAQEEYGLSKEEIREIAQDMPNGTAASLLLVEHLWAKDLIEVIRYQDGVVLANDIISPSALVDLGSELAEAAEIAEDVKAKLKAERPKATREEAGAAAGE